MFLILFSLLIVQRISELFIAKRNERWMVKRGGVEHGGAHYPYIVALHILFLLSLLLEVISFHKELTNVWYFLIPLLVVTQLLRYWSIFSLGYFWNTKIMIVPDETVVSKGPYRYVKHPNYIVVALEILFIPLLFQAYMTAVLFTILNFVMMTVRIPIEEKALKMHTNYQIVFQGKSRFAPKR